MNTDEHEQFNLPDVSETPSPLPFGDSENVQRIEKTLDIKGFYILNEKEFINMKGQRFNRIGVRGAVYSAATQDYLIGITALAVAPSIGLPKPSIVGPGKTFIIKDEVGGAATTNVTIRSEGEATIDGASSSTINTNYGVKSFYTDSINWFTY